MVMCLAHEGILVISASNNLFCKELLFKYYFYKTEKKNKYKLLSLSLSHLSSLCII
ncbi:hypothetical protein Hanom_Chr12g01150931 [Helianthus anomalus]